MSPITPLCDSDQLEALLECGLDTEQERDVMAHLGVCERCRSELESRAAERASWDEAKAYLTQGRDEPAAHDDDSPPACRPLQIQHVLEALAPTDDPEMLGRLGGYEVSGVVGTGGMGVVLKALDKSLDRTVAIKVLAPHLASSGAARKRFAREAKAAAAVLHPNVMAIHSVSNDESLPYLVMPYLRGESLQKRLDHEGPLPVSEILRIGSQIAAGLAAAHAQGLVHRDIKPANILLENGVERVAITDFGLARAVDDATMTRTGMIAGTPQFMSPEQARGESVDQRSDLFSLGSVLHAMCTGRPPFRAETSYGILRRITDNEPRPIREITPDVPEWLCAIIARLMAKCPADRFTSASEVAELLEDCLAHVQQPTAVPLPQSCLSLRESRKTDQPLGASPRFPRKPPANAVRLVLGAALSFLLILAGILIVLELNKGTLTIQCDADDIPIRIMQRDVVVEKLTISKAGASVRVAAGKYVVEIDGEIDGIVVQDGTITLKRGADETVRIVSTVGEGRAIGVDDKNGPRAWQQAEPYIGPSFANFFPDNADGGIALDKLWNAADKDFRTDQEILKTVRRGLRRTREHRTLVLGWLGNKYIWNKSPQNPDAIEIMYHAADFSGERADPYGTRHYAVYFGLSVVQPKSPAILRTLAELGMRVDDPNDLGRIAWGTSDQKRELLEHLKPFHAADDETVRNKAAVCEKIFSGELPAFAWAAEQARLRAMENYAEQLPQFKEVLQSGSSEDRRKTLETILGQRISLIMDDSFLAALAKCAEDSDPGVRDQATIIAGGKWIWEAENQHPDAITLMLRLSEDADRQVRYDAVYYGLSTVRNKSDDVVRRLLEMALADREWNLFSRIEWGLRDDRERAAKMLDEYMEGSNQQHATAAREIFRKLIGRDPARPGGASGQYQSPQAASQTKAMSGEIALPHQFRMHWSGAMERSPTTARLDVPVSEPSHILVDEITGHHGLEIAVSIEPNSHAFSNELLPHGQRFRIKIGEEELAVLKVGKPVIFPVEEARGTVLAVVKITARQRPVTPLVDIQELNDTWRLVGAEIVSQRPHELPFGNLDKSSRIVIRGSDWEYLRDGNPVRKLEATYDLKASPQTVDLKYSVRDTEKHERRLFELHADTLITARRVSGADDFPSSFDEPQVLIERYQRIGVVISVSDSDKDHISIALGSADGIRPQQRLQVSDGSSPLGTVEVSAVRENESYARVVHWTGERPIRKGDRVNPVEAREQQKVPATNVSRVDDAASGND